jgi:chemotaxis protein MotB
LSRRKHEEEKHGSDERWLITYADLITLLMIFFVVMYSFSVVDAKKFEQVAASLTSVLNGRSPEILDFQGPSVIEGLTVEQMQMEEIRKQLQDYIDNNNLAINIQLYLQDRGLVISLNDTILFESGQAKLTHQAEEIMLKVGQSLVGIPNYVRIEGHSDNLPISNAQFASNWELSALRATNVLRYLIKEAKLNPARLSESGYGEYRPIAANESEAGRARNRRVDIVIMKSEHAVVEPH